MSDGGNSDVRAAVERTRGTWLTASEVKDRLGWAENTVYRHLASGQIPGARMRGGRWRVPAWLLESWWDGDWEPAHESWEAWAERHGLNDPGAQRGDAAD